MCAEPLGNGERTEGWAAEDANVMNSIGTKVDFVELVLGAQDML